MKKALRGAQTLRAGCSKAEPKMFAPSQTPFPGARDGQNLISWRWSLYLYLQTQFDEDRCTQFRVIAVTDPHCPPATDRGDYNTLRRSLARSVKMAAKTTCQCCSVVRVNFPWLLCIDNAMVLQIISLRGFAVAECTLKGHPRSSSVCWFSPTSVHP